MIEVDWGYEEELEKLKTVKERVMWILKHYPAARNDYRLLVHLFHYYFDNLKQYIPFNILRNLTPPESITRAARYIQNELGLYPPTQRTRTRRRKKQEVYQRAYGRREV